MKIQNKILILGFLLIGIFFVSQFFDFRFTGDATTETVENTNDVGKYSSIAIDSNNKIHISHFDDTLNYLAYCNNTAGSWSCATVDTSPVSGQHLSMAIDSNNKIHISHTKATNDDLRYCNNTEGSWSCAIVESVTSGGGGNVQYSSIAIDSNNKVHISHYNVTGGDLRYCNNTEGSWSCADVDTDFNVGKYSSIAIDSNDKVHISSKLIGATENQLLNYCNNTEGSWSCAVVDNMGSNPAGEHPSIAIDSNDKIHISHYGDFFGFSLFTLRYCNNTAGSWSCVEVDTSVSITVGVPTSIAIDSNDKVHISHYDPTNDDLRYCHNSVGSWVCSKLADADSNELGTPNGRFISIKKGRIVDSTSFSGSVHISWYNNTDLMYTSYDPFDPTATATCSPSTIAAGDSFPCTCSGTDSAGTVTTSGSTSDTSTVGSFTYTCTVTDGEGNTANATASYTVEAAPTVVTGALPTTPLIGSPILAKSHLLVQVLPGVETTLTTFENTGVKEVTIEVNQEAVNVRIKVSKYDEKPTEVSVENTGKTYRYLQISTENLNEVLEKAKVKFEVEKTWVSENSLQKEDLAILKFDESAEKWNELVTGFDSEDDNFYYYVVELDSFSFFAIGEKSQNEIVSDVISEIVEEEISKINFVWMGIFIGILLIVGLIGYVVKKRFDEGPNNFDTGFKNNSEVLDDNNI